LGDYRGRSCLSGVRLARSARRRCCPALSLEHLDVGSRLADCAPSELGPRLSGTATTQRARPHSQMNPQPSSLRSAVTTVRLV